MAPVSNYDPKDELPVLDKMQKSGWISRHWQDRQDLHVEWTAIGRNKMREFQKHIQELGPLTENQEAVLAFYLGYFAP